MRYRKFVILLLFYFLSMAIPVSAHPGATDNEGGHIDTSTSDYHYHHGYPAHAHYDMDGDGVIDCPYNFDDQTDHSYSNDTSSSTGTRSSGDAYVDGYSDGYDKGEKDGQDTGYEAGYQDGHNDGQNDTAKKAAEILTSELKKARRNTFLWTAFGFLIIIIPTSYFRYKSEAETLATVRSNFASRSKQDSETIASLRSDLSKLCAFTRYQVSEKSRAEFRFYYDIYGADNFDIPNDVYFINDYVPVKGKVSAERLFGDFTVYIPSTGKRYHSDPHCCNGFYSPVHIYDIAADYLPCSKCAKIFMSKPPDWYVDIKRIIDSSNQHKSETK